MRVGSSLGARGTWRNNHSRTILFGFIPACAGNCCCTLNKQDCGSSPHTRGTPSASGHLRSCYRFIPACAGNCWLFICPVGIWMNVVHPRERGTVERIYYQIFFCSGSSPRTGKPSSPRTGNWCAASGALGVRFQKNKERCHYIAGVGASPVEFHFPVLVIYWGVLG